jgi:hypothetical protein
MAAIRSTPLFKELMATQPRLPRRLNEFITETGFAIDQDVDAVTVGRLGPRDFLAVIKARYNRQRVEYYLSTKQIPSETLFGRVIHHPDDKAAVSFLDDMILAGTNAGVRAAIERLASVPPSDVRRNTALMDGIRTIEAGNQIWAIGEFSLDMLPRGLSGPPEAEALLQEFTGGIYQMRIDDGMHIRATGNFQSAESARTAGDLLRGVVALGKLRVSANEDMLHLLDGLAVDDSGSTVVVRFSAPGDLLIRLRELRTLRRAE